MGHRNALLTAYDKDGLDDFARELTIRDWNVYASERTAEFLRDRHIPALDIRTLVGKSILGHRVMTLSRETFAGLLAAPDDAPEMYDLGLPYFDLVYVNLYPIEVTRRQASSDVREFRRMIDFGGRALLSAAAYGNRLVLCEPSQFTGALEFIDGAYNLDADRKNEFLLALAIEAEQAVATHSMYAADCYKAMLGLYEKRTK